MNKKIIYSVIALFSFFIIGNVKAYITSTYTFSSNNVRVINTFKMDKEEIDLNTSTYIGCTASQSAKVSTYILNARKYYENNLASTYNYYFISFQSLSDSNVTLFITAFNSEAFDTTQKNYLYNSARYGEIFAFAVDGLKNTYNVTNTGETVANYYTSDGSKFTKTNSSTPGSITMISSSWTSKLNNLSVYYETNYNVDITLNDVDVGSIYNDLTYDDIVYEPGDVVFNSMSGLGVKPKEPTLQFKKSFNSGTNASSMRKIAVEFSGSDDDIINNQILFKLQAGANDFNYDNVPILSQYKIYGKRTVNSSEWSELDLNTNYGDEDDEQYISISDYNLSVDNSPGKLTENIYTFTLNLPPDLMPYALYKIEFYFDNTSNFYLYMYDSLKKSDYYDIASYFENYAFYIFKKEYRYAFISSSDETMKDKIYYPTHAYNNDNIKLKAYKYNYSSNEICNSLDNHIFNSDDYYSYFEFDLKSSDKNSIVLAKNITDEKTSFYVPLGYSVSFSKGLNDKIDINTPDGFITNNSDNIQDDNIYDDNTSHGLLYDILVSPFIDYLNKNLPILGQLKTIIFSFSFTEKNEIEPIKIDLSHLGMGNNYSLIDLNSYRDIRDIIFFFEYLGILFIAVPKFIGNLRAFFGGDD